MAIYYFMMEALPRPDNPEKEEFEGAFISCWVDSADMTSALTEASRYIKSEGWKILQIEEQFIAKRERYEGDPERLDLLEYFDRALEDGVSAIFHVWPKDEK
ncbi:hypothetical protein ACSFXN_07060 [Planococcus sp. 1R117A]|uniref:hypothetical protein n=1 Tax=Planococcus sp. 1R117A TaxID=3447020 RepID=UPI003EDBF157